MDRKKEGKSNAKKGEEAMNQFLLRKKLYSDPPKKALEAARDAMKRLQVAKAHSAERSRSSEEEMPLEDEEARKERERQYDLIGELKAAEARNRLRVVRLRYEANRTQEINHLVSSQATALEAVRLKVMLPTTTGPSGHHERMQSRDTLGKLERQRVERLIELPIEHFIRRP